MYKLINFLCRFSAIGDYGQNVVIRHEIVEAHRHGGMTWWGKTLRFHTVKKKRTNKIYTEM